MRNSIEKTSISRTWKGGPSLARSLPIHICFDKIKVNVIQKKSQIDSTSKVSFERGKCLTDRTRQWPCCPRAAPREIKAKLARLRNRLSRKTITGSEHVRCLATRKHSSSLINYASESSSSCSGEKHADGQVISFHSLSSCVSPSYGRH
jgi:hypothetical protein